MNIDNPISHLAEQKQIVLHEYCAEQSSLATKMHLEGTVRLAQLKDRMVTFGYHPVHFTRLKRLQVLVDGISFHVNESGVINANSISSPDVFLTVMTKVGEMISPCLEPKVVAF